MSAKEIKTGWRIVTGILVSILLLALLTRILTPLLLGHVPTLGNLVNIVLTGWLCWSVYQGNSIARVILVGLLLLNAALLIRLGDVLLAFGLIHLIFGLSLFLVPQVNRYFEYAKNY